MKDKYDISIIIPVYNAEKYIDKCIDSIVKQKENVEIICINDGSTDKSLNILNKYKKEHNIKIINKKNEGQGLARNEGIKLSSGKYIMFLDSDDYMVENSIKKILNNINDNDLFIGTYIRKYPKSEEQNNIEETESNSLEDLYTKLIDINNNVSVSSCDKVYKRSIIEKYNINFLSEREFLSEDIIFNLDYIKRCQKYIIKNIPIFNYVQHQNSFSHRYQNDLIKKFNNILEKFSLLESKYDVYIKNRVFSYYKTLISNEIRWINKNGYFNARTNIKKIIKELKSKNYISKQSNIRDKILYVLTNLNCIDLIIIYEKIVYFIKKVKE